MAITGVHAGLHCIFPREGSSGGRQRPPSPLQVGKRSCRGPACSSAAPRGKVHAAQASLCIPTGACLVCLAGPRLRCQVSNETGQDLDGRRQRSPPNPTQVESGPSLTHEGLASRRHQIPELSISITDQSCKMNSGALCTVRGQREEVRGKEGATASRACPSALWKLRQGHQKFSKGSNQGCGSPRKTLICPIFSTHI